MKSKQKVKVNFKRLFILILFLYAFIYFLYTIINIPIRNIYIKNNSILTDQTIIEQAGLEKYPSIVTTMTFNIEKKLKKNIFIKKAIVKKRFPSTLEIEIIENKPTFYNRVNNKIILQDGKTINGIFNVGTLINYVPDQIYGEFITKMALVEQSIIERISEIEYKPNEVDNQRFFLTMKDGNYVYLTIREFQKVNDYLNIVKTIGNKKGILYLDDAEFFELIK